MKVICVGAVKTITTIVALLLLVVSGFADDQQSENATPMPTTEAAPISEEPIKYVHVLSPGEREYLSPNLLGVQNIAMTFLPLTMNFINIIDAYREIVNGVRYEIVLNAIDTRANDAEVICRLVILEKPWIRTEWGDKYRELVNTNCSSEAMGNNIINDSMERDKPLNDKHAANTILNSRIRNELSADEMAQLESQIIPITSEAKAGDVAGARSQIAIPTTITSEGNIIANGDDAVLEMTTLAPAINGNDEDTVTTAAAAAEPAVGVGVGETTTPTPSELNDNEKQWLDGFLSVGAYNFEKSLEANKNQLRSVNDEMKSEGSAGGERVGEGEKATSEEMFIINLEENNQQSNYENANNYQQQLNGENSDPQQQQQQQQQQYDNRVGRSFSSSNLVGGANNIDKKKAEETLQASLDKLANGDGPSYRISKVYSASTQVVSGTLTKIDAELIDAENKKERCNVDIWSQPWLPNGIEVTFKCNDKQAVRARHSRSVEYAEKKTHKKHNHHNLDKMEHLFHKFQLKFKRHYSTSMERQMRLRIFRQNLKTIEELNRNEMGSAKYGITEFADMTSSEYKQRTGLWQREPGQPTGGRAAVVPNVGELPKEFDWRVKNGVTHVKNQGNCGSCWAFSVTGNIEGLYAIKTGELREFSEQELLDCDTIDSACNGGLPDNAYKALEQIGGLEYEGEYPYAGKKQQCHFNKTEAHVTVTDFVDLPHNETAMQHWLIANGPISIGINANAMQFYRGGVSHPWKPLCSKKNLDHGVLIVGYGISEYPNFHKTLPYWIVKNSWGPKWGEQGYYRVYRGDNTCGVTEMATSAVIE